MRDGPQHLNGPNGLPNGLNGSNGHRRPPAPPPRARRPPPRRWQDRVTLLLGAWLFVTPWVWPQAALLQDPPLPGESAWAARIPGAVIAAAALWAWARPAQALPEWVLAGAGFWLVLSPCLPGFALPAGLRPADLVGDVGPVGRRPAGLRAGPLGRLSGARAPRLQGRSAA